MVTESWNEAGGGLALLATGGAWAWEAPVRRHMAGLLAADISVRGVQVLAEPVRLELLGPAPSTTAAAVAVAVNVDVTLGSAERVVWTRGAFTLATWTSPDGTRRERTWFEPGRPLQHAVLALGHRLRGPR
ncbi:hypothetical protein [Streptomyces sp. NPDC048111]|uniref:hypothetical protein n=1 Tax=Streptomyces sp. NPDC048111 TaxID=3365500 RepID=UPI003723E084